MLDSSPLHLVQHPSAFAPVHQVPPADTPDTPLSDCAPEQEAAGAGVAAGEGVAAGAGVAAGVVGMELPPKIVMFLCSSDCF